MKKTSIITMIILIFLLLSIGQALANNTISNDDVFNFLQEASAAQLTLATDFHSLDDVNATLSSYFTEEYITEFTADHVYEEDEGYIVYGTDVSATFIPFFSYDDRTKVQWNESQSEIYVYEWFTYEDDSPYWFEDQFTVTVIQLSKTGWLISNQFSTKSDPLLLEKNEMRTVIVDQTSQQTDIHITEVKRHAQATIDSISIALAGFSIEKK
ncbi:DUF3993 domain-containing protein [Bacillus sp. HMF5848]|uniref:DUF3993 domain-containing protein n=1 Tax=Bacillus sp. HMF5848 TaxID=2495421 RepID=UPI000F7799A1|nr:DUF3993 domain-containing protein [Bacillus sp. HMF5848]RSK26844.1 DUF3993 domain-containing protein [Bacillus sp. HMF5848]